MSIIYKTTNLVNGKIYVGQHFTSADDGYLGSGKVIKQSIKKYGKENFVRETLEFCSEENVDERERVWIFELNVTDRNIGYNLNSGGSIISLEVRNKISNNHANVKGNNNPMYGVKRFGKNNPNFGKKWSQKMKDELSQIKKNKTCGEDNHFYGKQHSGDSKRKMSNSSCKFIWEIENKNYEIFFVENLKEYCKNNNLSYDCLYNTFIKKQKLHKGLKIINRRLK